MLRTGKPKSDPTAPGFTLIELMIVMALLAIVISISVPTLSSFFRGRVLDSEARRLLSLTHSGQDRAISAGVPVVLWVDVAQRSYGLEEEPGFVDRDPKAQEFALDSQVKLELPSNLNALHSGNRPASSVGVNNPHLNLPQFRFMPDGTVDSWSLSAVRLVDRDGSSLWVSLARSNRMNFEIRSQPN